MISLEEKKIKSILDSIDTYLKYNRDTFLAIKIDERLHKCLNTYMTDLNMSLDRLFDYCEKYNLDIVKILARGKNDRSN